MHVYVDFDPSKINWESAFVSQTGGSAYDSSRYIGVYDHRGYGIFSSFLRYLVPVLKSVGKTLGKEVLATGAKTALDVVDGVELKDAVKKRAREGAHNMFQKAADATIGNGQKRKNIKKPIKSKRRKRGVGVYKL